jgi:threonylcarbamoyladenosine tRNA methylthiotransferase MtaB
VWSATGTGARVTSARVAFATLGCRLNQVDSQELQALLEADGFRTAAPGEPADVVVVNSCTVTARAEASDRHAIARAHREHPGARIVVTGCWAQTDPARVARQPGGDLVVGNADKAALPRLVARALAEPRGPARISVTDVTAARELPPAPYARPLGRSRAFVKIQEGCQHRCAFCIVPLARGASRSREPKVVLDQVRALVAAGHPEVVLTGVDLGHYGADLTPRTTLAALLESMVTTPGLRWIRLSSVLPAYCTPALLAVVTGSPIIAPHLHVPLQSGSDRILRRMRRPYNVARYRALVERLAGAIPALGLGADVIVGFPDETDDDFAETVRLVGALPFSYLHVFAYSDRQGTEAARLGGRVPARVIAARSRTLRELAAAKSLGFRRGLVGTIQEVLVLETRDRVTGRRVGLTGNYVEVAFEDPHAVTDRLVRVRVTAAEPGLTLGELT